MPVEVYYRTNTDLVQYLKVITLDILSQEQLSYILE